MTGLVLIACSSLTEPRRRATGSDLLLLADVLDELGDDGEQVADDAEVGDLEDRGLGVLVDRDDRLGGLHACPVLDGAGDADRDVQLRRDGLAGLADLELVRVPAGVGHRAGRADGFATVSYTHLRAPETRHD